MGFSLRTFGIAAALIAALSCTQTTRCDSASGDCVAVPTGTASLGQDIELAPGRIIEVGTSGARISLEAISNDSRCPTDVQCVWEGNATARVSVLGDSRVTRTVELNSSVEPKQVQVDGYVLRFVALAPAPVSTARIPPSSYRLTVRMERP
jgi:hypothetical protein